MVPLVALSDYWWGWGNLLFRWLHVIAAMAWIGASFYFIALDNHLEPPRDPDDRKRGVGGEAWEVHGGGFYRVEKFQRRTGAAARPAALVQVGGIHDLALGLRAVRRRLLLTRVVVPDRPDRRRPRSVGGDRASRSPGSRSRGSSTTSSAVRSPTTRACSPCWSSPASARRRGARGSCSPPRAAYLQVGAMIGTIMVGNVFFVIIPAHWKLVRAKEAGLEPDPKWNRDGKTRSVHNNYLTLPVVLRDALEPLPVHVRAPERLARARRADGDRRADAALLQPAPPRAQRVADPRRRRRRHRRGGALIR